MKTKIKPYANGRAADGNGVVAKRVILNGERMVILDETEFDRLLQRADLWEPTKPEPDADGLLPAIESGFISLAIDIIRDRRRLGLTQAELARRAGIRLSTLQKIESGERRPTSVRAIDKIDKVLQAAAKKAAKA